MLTLVPMPGRLLTIRECTALKWLAEARSEYWSHRRMRGVTTRTLNSLVALGLVEQDRQVEWPNEARWRITDSGWRAMYGMTLGEIMATSDSLQCVHYLCGGGRWKHSDPLLGRKSVALV